MTEHFTQQQVDSPLLQIIQQKIIDAGGTIAFSEYMALCLYHPEFGYYNTRTAFGRTGDFITAPTLSPLFAQCIANQCLDIFQHQHNPSILEIGAGDGSLAIDLLKILHKCNQLPETYYIQELSPRLKALQEKRFQTEIPELYARIQWSTPDRQPTLNGLVIGNELLDAMPVHAYEYDEQTIYERRVTFDQGLKWTKEKVKQETLYLQLIALAARYNWPEPYCFEMNTGLGELIQKISQALNEGVVLLIDYGFNENEYFNAQRTTGQLSCYQAHQCHNDVFYAPGLQDITCHVNFSQVADCGFQAGLTPVGFTNQAQFLLANSLTSWLTELSDNASTSMQHNQAIKRLTSPNAMGELFKVIAFSKNFTHPLVGLTLDNKLNRL